MLRQLVQRWGARVQHAVLRRVASHMRPQRATSFADGPTRHRSAWASPTAKVSRGGGPEHAPPVMMSWPQPSPASAPAHGDAR